MKEKGFVYDWELEFALIRASHQALPAATLLLLLSGMARPSHKLNQRLAEVEALRQRVAEIKLYLLLLLWLGAATCATAQHPCSQGPSGSLPTQVHCYPARLAEPGCAFLLNSPGRRW